MDQQFDLRSLAFRLESLKSTHVAVDLDVLIPRFSYVRNSAAWTFLPFPSFRPSFSLFWPDGSHRGFPA
jgi:hypothetical protein